MPASLLAPLMLLSATPQMAPPPAAPPMPAPSMPAAPMPAPDHAAAPCPAVPPPLPTALQGWTRRSPASAGATARQATALPIGTAVTAQLLPAARVAYAVPPEKPGDAASRGGLLAFTVATSGRYRVALGSGAWVDVVRGPVALPSVAHAHGPDCTDLRKMVDFDLTSGRYLLQIAGNGAPRLTIMVARLP